MAVDERRLAVEALAVRRGQELEVEVRARPFDRIERPGDPSRDLDDRRAEAGDEALHEVAVARERDLAELLGLTERLPSTDDRLLRGHRHQERVVADRPFVPRLHRERARAEGRKA